MKQSTNNIYKFILLTFTVLSIACSEEVENIVEQKGETVFDTLSTRPNARILTYVIENAPSPIYSAVNDSAGTVTVYLPHYYTIQFIDPLITLPDGASITPDGEELVPVFSEETFTYTVSAPQEEDKIYAVVPEIQQPTIMLDEFSTPSDTFLMDPTRNFTLTGANFIPDPNVTQVFLIHEDGAEWELFPGVSGGEKTDQFRVQRITFQRPEILEELPDGNYFLEMRAYALKARMQYPIKLDI